MTINIISKILEHMGDGMLALSKLINQIDETRKILDLLTSTFIHLPIVANALSCSNYNTIILIFHASKILISTKKT